MGRPAVPMLQNYGLWTVISGPHERGKRLCRCGGCGREFLVCGGKLRSGSSSSCKSCSQQGVVGHFPYIRKEVLFKLDRIAQHAVSRCTDPTDLSYEDYGGRGIEVRFNGRVEFVAYLLTLHGHDDFSLIIDRIDNNGHYEVGNLRFTTSTVSNNNRRSTKLTSEMIVEMRLKYDSGGVTQCQLAEEMGISQSRVSDIVGRRIEE